MFLLTTENINILKTVSTRIYFIFKKRPKTNLKDF